MFKAWKHVRRATTIDLWVNKAWPVPWQCLWPLWWLWITGQPLSQLSACRRSHAKWQAWQPCLQGCPAGQWEMWPLRPLLLLPGSCRQLQAQGFVRPCAVQAQTATSWLLYLPETPTGHSPGNCFGRFRKLRRTLPRQTWFHFQDQINLATNSMLAWVSEAGVAWSRIKTIMSWLYSHSFMCLSMSHVITQPVSQACWPYCYL